MENSIKKVNRCIAYNKNNKKCRAKIMNNDFFCCEAHKPLNYELIEGCFICNEKIDISYKHKLKCNHEFHYECLIKSFQNTPKLNKEVNHCPYCRKKSDYLPLVNGLKKIILKIKVFQAIKEYFSLPIMMLYMSLTMKI